MAIKTVKQASPKLKCVPSSQRRRPPHKSSCGDAGKVDASDHLARLVADLAEARWSIGVILDKADYGTGFHLLLRLASGGLTAAMESLGRESVSRSEADSVYDNLFTPLSCINGAIAMAVADECAAFKPAAEAALKLLENAQNQLDSVVSISSGFIWAGDKAPDRANCPIPQAPAQVVEAEQADGAPTIFKGDVKINAMTNSQAGCVLSDIATQVKAIQRMAVMLIDCPADDRDTEAILQAINSMAGRAGYMADFAISRMDGPLHMSLGGPEQWMLPPKFHEDEAARVAAGEAP